MPSFPRKTEILFVLLVEVSDTKLLDVLDCYNPKHMQVDEGRSN